jgi:hypothetical protein
MLVVATWVEFTLRLSGQTDYLTKIRILAVETRLIHLFPLFMKTAWRRRMSLMMSSRRAGCHGPNEVRRMSAQQDHLIDEGVERFCC